MSNPIPQAVVPLMSLYDPIHELIHKATACFETFSDSAQLDAEVLLCHCLKKDRSFLRAWPEHQPDASQICLYQEFINKREQGWPVAYIIGNREFWSRSFKVTPDVLIPRPDSELLVELCLDLLPSNQESKIIDLGTGSGILAITLAAERPLIKVTGTDFSFAALEVAIANAKSLQISNVNFIRSNWFDAVDIVDFDLVISNPPYIAHDDPHLQLGDIRFEPKSALISAEQGTKDIRLLAEQARRHLKHHGRILIEHGYDQHTKTQSILNNLNYRQITTHSDLTGNPRVTSGIWDP